MAKSLIDVLCIFCCCVRVSKRAMHDRVRDDTAPVLCKSLKTAGIIGKGSRVDIELKNAVRGLRGLCPIDSYLRPVPSLKRTHIPPIPYTCCGYDFTMTPPKGHVPPSQRSCAPKKMALADNHLIVEFYQLYPPLESSVGCTDARFVM